MTQVSLHADLLDTNKRNMRLKKTQLQLAAQTCKHAATTHQPQLECFLLLQLVQVVAEIDQLLVRVVVGLGDLALQVLIDLLAVAVKSQSGQFAANLRYIEWVVFLIVAMLLLVNVASLLSLFLYLFKSEMTFHLGTRK